MKRIPYLIGLVLWLGFVALAGAQGFTVTEMDRHGLLVTRSYKGIAGARENVFRAILGSGVTLTRTTAIGFLVLFIGYWLPNL